MENNDANNINNIINKNDGTDNGINPEKVRARRKIKDSIFGNLFSYKENLLWLYRDLHPEDTTVTEDDITDVTIDNIMVDKMYNDLGFTVGDRLILLVEAQSTWSVNICVRMLMYLADTYNNYIHDRGMSVYSSAKLALPKPELYVVYTGEKDNVPEAISLADDFFGGASAVDVRVSVLRKPDLSTIVGQYIVFCKVFDEQRRLYGSSAKSIIETLRICKDDGVLFKYLESHEKEVITLMTVLHDEEYVWSVYERERERKIRKESLEEGEIKGRTEGRTEGRAEGRAEEKAASVKKLIENGFDLEKALSIIGIDEQTYNKYTS